MMMNQMLLVALGRAIQFVLLLLTLRVATGILTPAEMGKVSLVTATVAFFSLFFINPVGMFINRRMHDWDLRGQVRKYLRYFCWYLVAVCLIAIFLLTLLVVFKLWSPSISLYWLSILVCGSIIFGTLNQSVIPWLNLLGYRGWFTALTVSTSAASLIFAISLVLVIAPTAEYWFGGLLIGQLALGLIGAWVFLDKLNFEKLAIKQRSQLSYSHISVLFRFAWPVAIAVMFGWIQCQSYRYLVEQYLSLSELGLFVAGFGISSGLILGFESIFSTYFQPKFYRRVSVGNVHDQVTAWQEYAQVILPSILLTAIFIMIVAPELTLLLLGPAYKDSSHFVMWGAVAEVARAATAVFAMAAHARMKTKMLIFPNVIGALMSVLLVWLFIPIYGLNGVGFGLVGSAFAALMLSINITRRYITLAMPTKQIMKSIIIGIALLVIAVTLRKLLDYDKSFNLSLIQLSIVGACFLWFQYSLLLPALKQERRPV
jgi:O-antigen/teichoic acid export membrane protein